MARLGKKKKVNLKKGDGTMGAGVIGCILQIVSNVTSLTNKAVDASDPEKYAEGIHALNRNIDDTYAKMREVIMNSNSFTEDEKLERLEKLAKSQEAARKSCEHSVQENRAHMAKIITEMFLALTTCGISYIPKAVKGRKKVAIGKSNDILIEGDIVLDDIDETCFFIDEFEGTNS